jgi:hypothetical protein
LGAKEVSGTPNEPAESWPHKLGKALIEHALKIVLAGVLAWIGLYLGGQSVFIKCTVLEWFSSAVCR